MTTGCKVGTHPGLDGSLTHTWGNERYEEKGEPRGRALGEPFLLRDGKEWSDIIEYTLASSLLRSFILGRGSSVVNTLDY